jgi:hypothetical protein
MIMKGIKTAFGQLALDMYEKEIWGSRNSELKDLNLCLLGAWVKRYISDEGRMWRSIVDRKYCSQGNIFYADRNNVSFLERGPDGGLGY